MKRFITAFTVIYGSMVLLFAFLIFVAPDVLPGDPPLTGSDRLLDWIASPVRWFLVVFTFPWVLVCDRVDSFFRVDPLLFALLCWLLPASFWTGVFLCGRALFRRLKVHVQPAF